MNNQYKLDARNSLNSLNTRNAMNSGRQSRLHRRVYGLSQTIVMKIDAYRDGRADRIPLADLQYILSRLGEMLRDDEKDCAFPGGGTSDSSSDQELNTQCEFFDISANRIQCAIGCDMYHCSRNCCYATNMPNPTPPYCTKYMKGML